MPRPYNATIKKCKNMKKIILTLTLLLCAITLSAQQAVRTVPSFIVEAAPGPIHIYFDANAPGVPAGLRDAALTGTGSPENFLYVHTGLVTTTSAGNWAHTFSPGGVDPWGTTHEELRMERMPESYGTHVWRFVIPNLREFYGVTDADERVLRIMLVIRNAAGNVEFPQGWGNDIALEVFETEFNLRILDPINHSIFVEGDVVTFYAESSEPADLAIYINNVRRFQMDNTPSIAYTGIFPIGAYTVTVAGRLGEHTQREEVFFAVRGPTIEKPVPGGVDMPDGINYHECGTAVTFVVSAPHLSHIFVIGDFNDWRLMPEFQMFRQSDAPWPDIPGFWNTECDYWYVGYYRPGGPRNRLPRDRFWLTVTGLTPGKKYAFQYVVDDSIVTTDIFSKYVLDPWNDQTINFHYDIYPDLMPFPAGARRTSYAGVLQTNRQPFPWVETNFVAPPRERLVIYELLIRDFLHRNSFETLLDSLTYLQRLGVNAIKLMPLNEFDGNDSWGYNPSFFFAVDKAYGTREQLKRFINEAHRRGIAVILDVVYSHTFGNSPTVRKWFNSQWGLPADNNPYHNVIATHPFSVGENLNHCSPFTRYMVRRAIMFWMEEFRLDGFRFDLSKGFTQNRSLWCAGEIGVDHHCWYSMSVWNARDQERINNLLWYSSQVRQVNPNAFLIMEHFADRDEEYYMAHHPYQLMFWRNTGRAFIDLAAGRGNNIRDSYISGRNFISYMESHDEQRVPYEVLNFGNNFNPNHNMRDTTVMLQRMAATANIFLTTPPGPRMIWQFGEIGYHYPINFCYNPSTGEGYHGGEGCRTGRMPIPWDMFNDPRRQTLFDVFSTLIHLRTTHPAFEPPMHSHRHWVGSGNDGRLRWTHARNSDGSQAVIAVSNLDIFHANIYVSGVPHGYYYRVLGSSHFPDRIHISGGSWGFNNIPPGEFALFTRGSRFQVPDIVVPPYFSLSVDAQVIDMGDDINITVVAERHTRLELFFNDQLLVSTSQNTINHRLRHIMSVGDNELWARITSDFGVETKRLNIVVNEVTPTSVLPEIPEQHIVAVFPNPVTDMLYIQSETTIDRVEVYDLRGRLMMERQFSTNQVSLDLSSLSEGVYILRIHTGDDIVIQRVVKH